MRSTFDKPCYFNLNEKRNKTLTPIVDWFDAERVELYPKMTLFR